MAKKWDMREVMPVTAALIAEFRVAFGAGNINDVVRRGIGGEPVFYAFENGHAVGTLGAAGVRVGLDAHAAAYLLDGPQPGDPVDGPKGVRVRRKCLTDQNWGKK